MENTRVAFTVLCSLFIICIIKMSRFSSTTLPTCYPMTPVHGGSTDNITQTQFDTAATGRDASEMRSSGMHSATYNPFKAATYEPSMDNCVIKRFDNITSLHAEPKPQNKCTLAFTHDYFKRTKQFYGKGAWYTKTMDYRPDDCSFTEHTKTPDSLASCLKQRNVTKIVMTGDSTMRYRYGCLVGLFADWTCREIKHAEAETTEQLEYFTVPDVPPTFLAYEYFVTDRGNMTKCTLGTFSVYLEYISLICIIDGSIRIKRPCRLGLEASSKQEYLLKYYFPHHGFPDLWIYRTPFRHEIMWRNSTEEISIDISYALQLFRLYLPPTTSLVIETDSRECHLSEEREQTWKLTFPNSTRNEMLHAFNQAFYDVFGAMTSFLPNMYGFLDDMRLSCSMMCDYHRDGAHYNDQYYTEINRYVLELFCAMG